MSTRVGALYYEVILDPSAFSKGATKVRSEQKMLQKSLEKSKINDPNLEKNLLKARLANIQKLRAEGKISASMAKKLRDAEYADWKRHIKKKEQDHKAAIEREIQRERDKNDKIIRYRRMLLEKERLRREKEAASIASGRHDAQRTFQMGGMAGIKRNIKDITDAVGKANGGFAKFSTGLSMVQGKIGSLMGFIFPLVLAFGALAAAVAKVTGILSEWVKSADRVQLQLSELKVILGGNEDAAKKLRKELQQYAKETAFSVSQTADLAKQLIALGMTAEEVVPKMRLLGNLAMGDPQKLKLIAKAYMDVRTQTKLMATEVRQFANQGIPLLSALAELTGKSIADIKDMMKEGRISAEMVGEALELISAKWGNTAEARLGTIAGQSEQIAEQWEIITSTIGGPLQEDLVEILKVTNSILEVTSILTITLKGIGGGIRQFVYEVIPFGDKIQSLIETIKFGRAVIASLTDEQGRSAEQILEATRKEARIAEEMIRLEEERARLEEEREERKKNWNSQRQDLVDQLILTQYQGYALEVKRYELALNRQIAEKKLTREQARQLMDLKKKLLLDEQRAKNQDILAEKRRKDWSRWKEEYIEEERARFRAVKGWHDRRTADLSSSGGAAASFDAGSVAEYRWRTEMETAARRDASTKHYQDQMLELQKQHNEKLEGLERSLEREQSPLGRMYNEEDLGGDPLGVPNTPMYGEKIN